MDPVRIIVNADDLGYHERRDDAIIHAFQNGVVTSASLMVNGLSAVSAVKKAKIVNLPVGLHLNLSEGAPVSPPSSIPSLVVNQPYGDPVFLGKEGFWKACKENRIAENDVIKEVVAQMKSFLNLTGGYPLHVDGHQHVHVAPGISQVLAPLFQEYGVQTTRIPNENVPPSDKLFYGEVIASARASMRIYNDADIATTNFFVGMGVMGKQMRPMERLIDNFRRNVLRKRFEKGGEDFVEFMVHPGWVPKVGDANGGCGAGIDNFCMSKERETEMEVLESLNLTDFFKEEHFVLSNWSDLAQRTRRKEKRMESHSKVVLGIVAALKAQTGNWTTALRLRSMLCPYYDIVLIDTQDSCGNTTYTLRGLADSCKFLGKKFLVLALNANRARRLLRTCFELPYICIAGGTDVNAESNASECKDVLRNANEIIVFTKDMEKKIISLPYFNVNAGIRVSVVPQSIDIEEVISVRNRIDENKDWLRKLCSIPGESNFLLVLLPAGIRAVKDPSFLIDEVCIYNSQLEAERPETAKQCI